MLASLVLHHTGMCRSYAESVDSFGPYLFGYGKGETFLHRHARLCPPPCLVMNKSQVSFVLTRFVGTPMRSRATRTNTTGEVDGEQNREDFLAS